MRTNNGGRDLTKRKGSLFLNEKPQLQGLTETPSLDAETSVPPGGRELADWGGTFRGDDLDDDAKCKKAVLLGGIRRVGLRGLFRFCR